MPFFQNWPVKQLKKQQSILCCLYFLCGFSFFCSLLLLQHQICWRIADFNAFVRCKQQFLAYIEALLFAHTQRTLVTVTAFALDLSWDIFGCWSKRKKDCKHSNNARDASWICHFQAIRKLVKKSRGSRIFSALCGFFSFSCLKKSPRAKSLTCY